MELFLSVLDQVRYIVGTLVAILLLCHGILPARPGYRRRLALGCALALLLALLFVPLSRAFGAAFARHPELTAPYWLFMTGVLLGLILYWYETNPAGALFRFLMASCLESVVTVLLRYLFVLSLFPRFPEEQPLTYIGLMLLVYAVFYGMAYRALRPRIRTDESCLYPRPGKMALMYLVILLAYLAIVDAAKVLCENVILPLETLEGMSAIFYYLRFFCVSIMLLMSFVISTILVSMYNNITLENEKQVITQLARDRQSQYEFSKENIEMINRKCHDLKHQLKALERLSDAERAAQIREARRAIDFYDAVVRTGNEALDTLLTEKSVFCANRAIRLSCTVTSSRLSRIDLVDLYTLLGNAMDNAIESVDKLSDPEKKVISLHVRDQGQMLHIQIENYYEGSLELSDGLPVTTKEDKRSHGYGVKSIRAIVTKYDGELLIGTEGQVFSLQILIPA